MTDTMSLSDSVLLGVITSAHGLKGQFKVKSFTDPPSNLVDYGGLTLSSGTIITPRLVGVNKGLLICVAKEITGREQAEAIQKQELRIEREFLPPALESEVYQADYLGFTVVDSDSKIIGSIIGFHNFGAGDLIEVKPKAAESLFLPFTGFLIHVRLPQKQLVMNVPDGLIDKKTKKIRK